MSYHTDAHRAFYTGLRRTMKAPRIVVIKHTWGWLAETKDGQLLFESKTCCCAWCAKAEGLLEWSKRKEQ